MGAMSINAVGTYPLGTPKHNVTSLTVVNATSKTVDLTVPAGKKWVIQSGKIANPDDVARTCTVAWLNAGATQTFHQWLNCSIGAGLYMFFPSIGLNGVTEVGSYVPIVASAGELIRFVLASGGASAGGTSADGIVLNVLEIPA